MKMLKNNLFILYHVFKAVPMYMIGVLSCSVLQALLVAADLWVTKYIVNALLGEQFSLFGLLLFYGIYIITEYLVLQIKIILTNYFQSMKGIEISVYMRRLLYNKVKKLDLYCYENHEFYNDYERAVNEIDTRPVQVIDSLADFLSCVLSMFFITLVVFEPVFLLAAVGVVIEYLIYLKKLNRINYQMDRETSPLDRKINFVKMLFQNRDFVKESLISNADSFFMNWNDDAMKEDFKVSKAYYKKTIFPSVCSSVLGGLATFVVGIYLCRCMIAGKYNASDFVYLLSSFGVFSQSMIRLFQIFPEIQNHGMYIGNIKKILDYVPTAGNRDLCPEKGKAESVQPFRMIEFHKVFFSYPETDRTVLDDISFTLKRGDKAAIVGQNGCGKSTLIKLLLDFYHTEKGSILYNGTDYREYDETELRKVFGVVFQDYQIYAFSIAENVLMRRAVTEQDEEQVVSALQFAGLWEKVNSLENGIHTIITKEFDEQGVYFSGGECQKLVIARAYVRDAQILVFDEPTSALDAMAEYDFFEKIRKMGEDRTVVFVSHRLSATVSADCIYLIKDGKLAEKGTHRQLMEQAGDYCQMFTVQAKGYI